MSRYLSHLAALTLNRVEPVQPRLASRFESPVARGPSSNNGLDVAQESRVSVLPVHVQPSTATATDSPVAQRVVTASTDAQVKKESSGQDQPKLVEPTVFILKKFEPPGDEQKLSSGQGLASFNTKVNSAQTNRSAQSVNKPVEQASYVVRKDTLPTENVRTLVERVQERFTETTHSELVIREVAAPDDANQKTSKLQESLRPAPVKPASIVARSEQYTVGSNTPSQAGAQSVPSAQSGTDATPAPTIQVTIGRIEIRATSGADKTTSKPRAAATTMSLVDYLKQRNGGKS